ncbi:MAG TPA: molybdopterin-binding protein [Stenomitos sp.]
MPRKQQGWITFQSSEEERQILEQYCQQSQRTKTEILRELVRNLNQQSPSAQSPTRKPSGKPNSVTPEVDFASENSQLKAMKVSARNIIRGTVKRVVRGAVNTEVTLEIAPNVELISIITSSSAEQLDVSEGKEAYAVIKSSHIMIAME